MMCMYMHSTHAHALHKRTSLPTPPRAAERSMAVIMAATAAARPPTVDLRPLAAMAATSERPARVGVSTGQYVAAGWLGERVAELEVSGRPRTLRRREEVVVHGTPTGESNPAATSKSWWQGPPQGGSDRTVSTPPYGHCSHSHGRAAVR